MGDQLSRRDLLKIAGTAGAAAALPREADAHPHGARVSVPAPSGPAVADQQPDSVHLFFNSEEAEFVRTAVDILIPKDEWPSASEAGVVGYIDRQLAGAWGAGARLYLEGPFRDGTPEQGYQLPFTPAELYRNAIQGIHRVMDARFGGRRLGQLDTAEQQSFVKALESGTVAIGDVPSAVFFETLLANTIEGYFADPVYGGNRGMAGWRMVGFPGAYAAYAELVAYHGMAFDRPPISMAQHDAHDDHVAHHHR